MTETTLEAPGKMFLAGEYAVLDPGRSALVVAVDRTLRLSLRPDVQPSVELWHKPSLVALIGELTGEASTPVKWIGGVPSELRFAARATELALRLCADEKLSPRGYHATFEMISAAASTTASTARLRSIPSSSRPSWAWADRPLRRCSRCARRASRKAARSPRRRSSRCPRRRIG